MGVTTEKLIRSTIRNKDLWMYLIFLVICGLLAAARDCTGDYLAVILHPITLPVLLGIVILGICSWRGANTRIALTVLCMLTLAALMRVVIWNSYPGAFDEGEKVITKDYFLTMIVIFVVFILYAMPSPIRGLKFYELLSSRKFTFFLFLVIALLYVALFLVGKEYGGARQWIEVFGYPVQVTEIIKFLFVICLAAMMNRDEKPIVALFFFVINFILLGFAFSEFGTAMVMTFVFFIFLFIFPQKTNVYTIVGCIMVVLFLVAGVILFFGKKEYDYSLRQSDSRAFAAAMANNLYQYAMSTDETVVTMDILKTMVSDAQAAMKDENTAELKREFMAIEKQIEDRELVLADFNFETNRPWELEPYKSVYDLLNGQKKSGISEEMGTKIDAAIRNYPAVKALAVLCRDAGFRETYIHLFCSSRVYDNTDTLSLSTPAAGRLSHKLSRGFPMKSYRKGVERVVLWNASLRGLLGFEEPEKGISDQLGEAQNAMRIGGLRGAEKYEFYPVYVMTSDTIFSEMVSLYGFGMGFFVILLYMIFFREGIREAVKLSGKPFHRGLVLGITLMIFIQALIIIAGNLNVFPLTGITLPFIADGLMSMLVFGALVGILLAASYVPIVEAQLETESTKEQIKKPVRFIGKLVQSINGLIWSVTGRGGKGVVEDINAGKETLIKKGKDVSRKVRDEIRDIINDDEDEVTNEDDTVKDPGTKQAENKAGNPAEPEESEKRADSEPEKDPPARERLRRTKHDWNE